MLQTFQALPYWIGREILQAEFQIGSGNIRKQTIEKTVALYTEAIQYNIQRCHNAESQKDQQNYTKAYKFYQEKLRKFLTQREVSNYLQPQNCHQSNTRKRAISNPNQCIIQHEVEKAELYNEENSKNLLKKFMTNEIAKKRRIRKQLEQQNQNIAQRLERRVRIKSQLAKSVKSKDTETCEDIEI